MNGIPAIDINLRVDGTYRMQDFQADILSGSEIDVGVVGLMPEVCENPQRGLRQRKFRTGYIRQRKTA